MEDNPKHIKCKNKNCSNSFEEVKKGGHWKKFCNAKCRSQYHSSYGVLEGDKLVKLTAMTKVIYPSELLTEMNYRIGRINAGISNSGDLIMLSTCIDYMKLKVKEQSKTG